MELPFNWITMWLHYPVCDAKALAFFLSGSIIINNNYIDNSNLYFFYFFFKKRLNHFLKHCIYLGTTLLSAVDLNILCAVVSFHSSGLETHHNEMELYAKLKQAIAKQTCEEDQIIFGLFMVKNVFYRSTCPLVTE